MQDHAAAVRSPDDTARLAARQRPDGAPVMFQSWRDLLFLHWEHPAADIQRRLPPGLFVDTFEGRAYLGVVPFFMRRIRPRWLPALPGVSNFLELNVRTYVHDRAGVPGVWFFSLDANRRLAVAVARRFFHLPYVRARMKATPGADGFIRYTLRRAPEPRECVFEYAAGSSLAPARPGTFEFFLVERYHLYAAGAGTLWRGTVAHPPYPLCVPRVGAWDDGPLALNGFAPAGRAPDHALLSPGVDVQVFGLKPVSSFPPAGPGLGSRP